MTGDAGAVSAAVNEHLAEENARLKHELTLAQGIINGIRGEIRSGNERLLGEIHRLRERVDNLNNQVAMQDMANRARSSREANDWGEATYVATKYDDYDRDLRQKLRKSP